MRLHEAANPVVLFANALGDCVMALPTLRALARLAPGRLLLVLPASAPRPLFEGLGFRAIRQIPMQASATTRRFDPRRLFEITGELDLLIAPNPWFSESMRDFLALARPRRSIGFFPQFGEVLRLDFDKHTIDLGFDVVRHLAPGARPEQYAEPIPVPSESARFVAELRSALGGRLLLVAHNETKREKRLPQAVFAQTLRRFVERRPDWVAVGLGRAESGLEGEPPAPAVYPVVGLPLMTAIAVIAAADLFLGIDSFPLHAADLHHIPALGLFGPTRPEEFGFRFSPAAQVGPLRSGSDDMVARLADIVDHQHAGGARPGQGGGDREH